MRLANLQPLVSALGLAAAISACTASAPPATQHPPETAMHGGDEESAPDPACAGEDGTCNALDEDCDGQIDEGCGYQSGAVQVTLAWESDADLDLYVTEPAGRTIFFNRKHRVSQTGGQMDYDSRGECRPEQQPSNVENVFWPAPAPPGEYGVDIHYFSPCGNAQPTTATLSILVRGKLVGSYTYVLQPEERLEATRFQVH